MTDSNQAGTAEAELLARRWWVLVAMAGSASMIVLDQAVVTVALPTIGRQLGLSPAGLQWVVNADVLAIASLVALGGRLSGRFGPVRTFRAGVTLFILGSVLSALTPAGPPSLAWIITARAVQGAGAALMIPVSVSLVISAFTATARGRALAAYTGLSQTFLLAGPVLGGVLTQTVSWRAVFWVNLPLGLLVLLVARAVRLRPTSPAAKLPAAPVLLLIAGLLLVAMALQQAPQPATNPIFTGLALAAGIAVLAWFGHRQLRTATPLVDLRLARRPGIRGDVVVLGLFQFGLVAVTVFGSLYLQDVLTLAPAAAGLATLPFLVPLLATEQLGGWWFDRQGVRPPVLVGLATATAGLAAWTATLPTLRYSLQWPGMALTGAGLGLAASSCWTDSLSRLPFHRRPELAGLVQTVRQIGSALGVAAITATVLTVEPAGTRAVNHNHAATATATGFGLVITVFGLALLAAARLPTSRIATTGSD